MTSPGPGVGRPRNNRVDEAIARATTELLLERGYAGFTVDAVAARAGVGKAAIYRRFPTKQEMIFSVVVHGLRVPPPPDAGSLSADLAAFTQMFADQLSSAPVNVLAGLLADLYADPALGDRFSETFLAGERDALVELLDRAMTRRELTVRPDPILVQAMLMGPVFAWLLILDGGQGQLPDLIRTTSESTARTLLSERRPPQG